MTTAITGCKGGGNDTLTWYVSGDEPADIASVLEEANKIINPAIGMDLEIKYIDSASYGEKMKMKMAGSESFDLLWTGYSYSYQAAANMGGLYDITELIDEVGMKEVVPEFYLDSAKIDDRIYGVPNIQVVSNPDCLVIPKNIVESLNVDTATIQKTAQTATNLEDLKVLGGMLDGAFATIKQAKPDMYTYNPSVNILTVPVFETVVDGIVLRMDGSSDKMEIECETPEYEYSVQKIHEWYKNGYIRNDIASKGAAFTTDGEYQEVAVVRDTWKPGQDSAFAKRMAAEPAYILLSEPYVKRTATLATMLSVSAKASHPKEAVEFIKLINSDEKLFNLICWGIEGKHYNLNEDGRVVEIPDSGYNNIGTFGWKYGNQFNSLLTESQEANVWDETEKMNNEAKKSPMLGFVPNTDDFSTEIANIANVNAEYKAKRLFGTEDPAVWYGEYKNKLKEAGIDKVLSELQKQYDEFLKQK